MSREVQVVAWCDLDHEQPTPAEQYLIEINSVTREIDLCAEHALVLVVPLADAVDKYGRNPGAPSKPARRKRPSPNPDPVDGLPCPDCERRFTTPQGLGAHRHQRHGYRVKP